MISPSPLRRKFSVALLALALLLLPLSGSLKAQKRQPEKGEPVIPTVGAPTPAIISLGSSVINSATRLVQDDPYAEFRNTHYTNNGLLSERDEVRLGAQLHSEVIKKFKLTSIGQERVNRLGQRVARASLRPNLVYHFYVINDGEINAFSGPGGYIYVTTALLKMANDDELASVLSHEVGHVVARHSLKTIQQSQAIGGLADMVGSITGVAGDTAQELGKTAAQVVGSGLLLVHSREEEREADFLGVRALPKSGFEPQAMITMFQKLQQISQTSSTPLGTLFSDHPDVQERIDNTRYEIERMRRSASRSGGR